MSQGQNIFDFSESATPLNSDNDQSTHLSNGSGNELKIMLSTFL